MTFKFKRILPILFTVMGILHLSVLGNFPSRKNFAAEQDAEKEVNSQAQKSENPSLKQFQFLIGSWKGVGQPKRGSNKGAWIEKGEWKWVFKDSKKTIVFEPTKTKQFKKWEISVSKENEILLKLNGEDSSANYSVAKSKNELNFAIHKATKGFPDRLSFKTVAKGKRLIVSLERKVGESFSRMAEIGLTRSGSRFGTGQQIVECVVTGGEGTITVNYKGKEYFVCCTGCLDFFNQDPDKVMKEFFARQREKKKDD